MHEYRAPAPGVLGEFIGHVSEAFTLLQCLRQFEINATVKEITVSVVRKKVIVDVPLTLIKL